MANQNEFVIQFRAKDDEKVLKALQNIGKEQNKLVQSSQKLSNSQKKHTKTTKNSTQESSKKLLELAKENQITLQTTLDVERLTAAEKKAIEQKRKHIALGKQWAIELKKATSEQKKLTIAYKEAHEMNKRYNDNLHIQQTELKNTRHRIKNLENSLKKVSKTWKDAGVSTKTLNLALKGNARALAAVRDATNLTVKSTKRLKSGFFSITNDGRLLSNTLATLRSKILIVSFGATMLSKIFTDQVKKFAIQEASVKRLADVFGNEAAVSLDEYSSELQKVSNFGDEAINVVMATIGAFGANKIETKELTKATLDLATGMGLDLNTAALLVGKSVGSTTNALSRYGITLDATSSVSEKVAKITEMVQLRFGGLAEEMSRTTEGQLKQASMAFGDMAERIGEVLAPAVLAAARALKRMSEFITVERLKAFGAVMLTAAGAAGLWQLNMVRLAFATKQATKAQIALQAVSKKSLWGLVAAGIATAATALLDYFDVFKSNTETLEEEQGALNRRVAAQKAVLQEEQRVREEIAKGIETLQERLDLLNAETELQKYAIRLKRDLSYDEVKLLMAIDARNEEMKIEQKVLSSVNSLLSDNLKFRKNQLEQQKAEIQVASELKRNTLLEATAAQKAGEIAHNLRENEIIDLQSFLNKSESLYKESTSKLESLNEKHKISKVDKLLAEAILNEKIKKEESITNKNLLEEDLRNWRKYHNEIAKLPAQIENTSSQLSRLSQESADFTQQADDVILWTSQLANMGIAAETVDRWLKSVNYQLAAAPWQNFTEGFQKAVDFTIDTHGHFKDLLENLMDVATGELENNLENWMGLMGNFTAELANAQAEIRQAAIEGIREDYEEELELIQEKTNAEMDAMKETWVYQRATAAKRAKLEQEILDKQKEQNEEAKKRAEELALEEFRIVKDMRIAEATMSTAGAIANALNVTPAWAGWALAAAYGILGNEQIQAIKNQQPPQFAAGGLVGGNPHSMGGTVIEAEKGEFVVNKRAVDSLGLETLNKINSGNSGNTTNITFSGNVLSRDFIEDEAIPMIRDAVRRGSDIGIG